MKRNFSYVYLIAFVVIIVALSFLINKFALPQTPAGKLEITPQEKLTSFITTNLRNSYTPKVGVQTVNSTVYVTSWTTRQTNFTAFLVKNSNNDGIKELRTFVNVPTTNASLDLVAVYVKNVDVTYWKCVNLTKPQGARACESFYETSDGKLGKGIVMLGDSSLIVVCEIPKGSELYERNTCLSFG